jgi:hypothetical protein
MLQSGSINHSPPVVDAKFHLLRRSNYHHAYRGVAGSVLECIQNEIVQDLMNAVWIP